MGNKFISTISKFGFTLVEILVSTLILALVVSGIMASFISSQRFISRSQRRLQATYFARQMFEQLREGVNAQDWANPLGTRLEVQPGVWRPCGIDLGTWDDLGSPFAGTCDYMVEQAPLQGPQGYRQVQVRIRWQEP